MKSYKLIATFLLTCSVGISIAQNPIINSQFTADPTARVFNGKVYVYPSHDIISPVEPERKWFSMEDYHVYSSEDLVDWTDHGMILSQDDVPWVKPKSYSMWAPDCVEKDGRYYFYFPSVPQSGRGFGIGVAVGNSPEGPFRPMWKPMEGVFGIDPGILIDDEITFREDVVSDCLIDHYTINTLNALFKEFPALYSNKEFLERAKFILINSKNLIKGVDCDYELSPDDEIDKELPIRTDKTLIKLNSIK